MKAFVKIIAALGGVVALGGVTAYVLSDSLLRVEKIVVAEAEGSVQPLLFQNIEKDLSKNLQKFSSRPVWEVSLEEIMQLIETDRRVEKASVRRSFPNFVTVEITPRQPLLLLLGVGGELFPLATDASLLPALSVSASPDLPLLRGLEFFEDAEARKTIVSVMEFVPSSGLFSRASISEVRMNKEKEITFFLNQAGTQVLIGNHLDQGQAARIEQVLKYLVGHSIKGRVIDARFSKKVVVRVRNAS
jgi:cell division septal protein FtsQ